MEKINKLSIPVTIIIASVILGGFYYMTQANKQESIERQQRIEQEAKDVANKKEYTAGQRLACLEIYNTEGKKWNNTNGWRYDDSTDQCFIEYKASPAKTKDECDKSYKDADGKVAPIFISDWLLCRDGLFEKSF